MNNKNVTIRGNAAIVPVQSSLSATAPDSLEDSRDASIEKLKVLYAESVKHSASLVISMIGVGECVVEILSSFAPSAGKANTTKQEWRRLQLGGRVPFGWVQALRYKKIYEQRDALQQKFQELGINLTVEKAYRLLGGPDERDEANKQEVAPSFVGTAFGVNGQSLSKRRNELARDIEVSKDELNQITAKLENLQKLDSAYVYVQSFLAKPNTLIRPPNLTANIVQPFSMVAKENKDVAGFFHLLQASYQCKTGTRFSKRDRKDYREWLLTMFASDQSKLLKKLQTFIRDPDSAMNADTDFATYITQKRKDDEAAKLKRWAENKAYRDAESAATRAARMEFRKNNPRKLT